jgi:carbamoyl-phosphate synthase small subunit
MGAPCRALSFSVVLAGGSAKKLTQALLALEDGTVFEGRSIGAPVERFGEVVFNTSMTGYQEIFTDPSYCGQIMVMTNPQIGNYGANREDQMAGRPYIEGLVVRDFAALASNWRSAEDASAYLTRHGVPVIDGVDTRSLVRRLRSSGVMRGILSGVQADAKDLVLRAQEGPKMTGLDLASRVSTAEPYAWTEGVPAASPSERIESAAARFRVVAYDFGIKRDILRRLVQRGCQVTVVPAATPAAEVLEQKPDGVFLSNGPGDPEPLAYQTAQVRELLGRTPVFGICLGQQVLGLALGGRTYKLKFGHRGGNHPVLNRVTNRVEITAQNHGFCVDPDSLPPDVEVTHINLNDQTLEGFRHRNLPAFSVQYHPEAAPGPHDSHYLFDDFMQMMAAWKEGR